MSGRFYAPAFGGRGLRRVVLDDDVDHMIASGALECAPVAREQPHRRAAFRTARPLDVRKRRFRRERDWPLSCWRA